MQYRMIPNSYYPVIPVVNGNPYRDNFHHPAELNIFEQQTMENITAKKNVEKHGHTHGHIGATTCQDGHVHMHPGVTSQPIETANGHIHKIWGNTTFDDGHIHYYEANTSAPISLPNGYHTHYVEIKTTEDDGHVHIIKGFTQPSKSE